MNDWTAFIQSFDRSTFPRFGEKRRWSNGWTIGILPSSCVPHLTGIAVNGPLQSSVFSPVHGAYLG